MYQPGDPVPPDEVRTLLDNLRAASARGCGPDMEYTRRPGFQTLEVDAGVSARVGKLTRKILGGGVGFGGVFSVRIVDSAGPNSPTSVAIVSDDIQPALADLNTNSNYYTNWRLFLSNYSGTSNFVRVITASSLVDGPPVAKSVGGMSTKNIRVTLQEPLSLSLVSQFGVLVGPQEYQWVEQDWDDANHKWIDKPGGLHGPLDDGPQGPFANTGPASDLNQSNYWADSNIGGVGPDVPDFSGSIVILKPAFTSTMYPNTQGWIFDPECVMLRNILAQDFGHGDDGPISIPTAVSTSAFTQHLVDHLRAYRCYVSDGNSPLSFLGGVPYPLSFYYANQNPDTAFPIGTLNPPTSGVWAGVPAFLVNKQGIYIRPPESGKPPLYRFAIPDASKCGAIGGPIVFTTGPDIGFPNRYGFPDIRLIANPLNVKFDDMGWGSSTSPIQIYFLPFYGVGFNNAIWSTLTPPTLGGIALTNVLNFFFAGGSLLGDWPHQAIWADFENPVLGINAHVAEQSSLGYCVDPFVCGGFFQFLTFATASIGQERAPIIPGGPLIRYLVTEI